MARPLLFSPAAFATNSQMTEKQDQLELLCCCVSAGEIAYGCKDRTNTPTCVLGSVLPMLENHGSWQNHPVRSLQLLARKDVGQRSQLLVSD